MELTRYPPEGTLARFVEYFWTFDSSDNHGVQALRMFPTGVSGVLFQHHNGRPALGSTSDGRPVSHGGCPTSFVYGKRTRPSQTFANGPFALTGVVLKPQGLTTLLKTSAASLSDSSAQLNNFSTENIGDRLLNAPSSNERVTILREFLSVHAGSALSEDPLITESLHLIRRSLRSIRVAHLLRSLKISERQFQRRFVRAIGVSPHHYIRIVRFRKAMQMIKASRFQRLSDLAYDLNYADQSHFNKDIEAFTGYTPKRLVQTVQASVDLPCALILARADDLPTETVPSGRIVRPQSRAGYAPVDACGLAHCGHSSARIESPQTAGNI